MASAATIVGAAVLMFELLRRILLIEDRTHMGAPPQDDAAVVDPQVTETLNNIKSFEKSRESFYKEVEKHNDPMARALLVARDRLRQ